MEIGNDDIDFMDDELDYGLTEQDQDSNNASISSESQEGSANDPVVDQPESNTEEDNTEESLISSLLKGRGITDPSKIKFENENGEIEELNWNDLSNSDKLNILSSSEATNEDGLDDSEIELINTIRQSQLTPKEYIDYLQRSSVENYINNSANTNYSYQIDQYSDDELYIMDLISRSNDITEEEAIEALERAKTNEALFKKQMGAIRNEYKQAEEEANQYAQLQQEQAAQEQFNQFADQIEDSIINFTEFSGCELNMSDDDMQDLYNFITGTDSAGNSWFGKALSDPETVVQMAWFLLNGEKMIQDISEYYQKEITNVRKESYNKGLKAAEKKDKPTVTYKPKSAPSKEQDLDDLDDF